MFAKNKKQMRALFPLFFAPALFVLCVSCRQPVAPPAPYGAVPSASQLAWQQMEYYMFVHFGPNTFTDLEWGDGKEDPRVFHPTRLDCRQWAETAKKAGMKGILITAKHHDGFCLWPSRYSTHTVRESLWENGQGDVLKELSAACREAGLKFGVYLSPWDRNHPAYGTPEYNPVFAGMLAEVLSGYGEIFEQWFDGANGEGENGKKQVYDWRLFNRTVCEHQPQAVIFSDVGPGCRWIGNEEGRAGETNWSRLHITGFEPGNAPSVDTLNAGNREGEAWVPGETDVSIRPGWFYSPATDDKVKTLEQLTDIYYTSVGRNSNLLLNVPPDRNGRIHPNDSTRLMELRGRLDSIFSNDLLKGATITATATRGNAPEFKAANVLDPHFDTYWTTDDTITGASLELHLNRPQTFNLLLLQEYIPLGQRVAAFNVEYWDEPAASWQLLASATTIGYKRILRLPLTTTDKLRINILHSLACPVLNTVALYKE
jgi:alpha-L-fucosidase